MSIVNVNGALNYIAHVCIRPKFSAQFIINLEYIQAALDKGESGENEMIVLIRKFGTHYSTKTDFGAKMVYEEMFSSVSEKQEKFSNRNACSRRASEGCLAGRYGHYQVSEWVAKV